VGKSGCGKSTLLRLLAGLERPNSGAIQFDQSPVTKTDSRIRVIFQDPRLLPWESVLANIALASKDKKSRHASEALALLKQVGLENRGGDWPSVLSGGQRQRVALARALMTKPRLLLFDEPLGALDALTRLEMQELIESLWLEQRFTGLLVTHDVEEAVALADRVLLIEDRRITLDVKVKLARPRDRSTPEFATIKSSVLNQILKKVPKEQAPCMQRTFVTEEEASSIPIGFDERNLTTT
jgi:sulfonate transport system ATP-binding protein